MNVNNNNYAWTNEEIEQAREYYSHIPNLIKIQQFLTDRETIFKSPNGMIIRCIKSQKANYLQTNLQHYEMLKYCFNIYNSIATYRNFPLFSWSPSKRREQYADWTQNEKYKYLINGYDFYMDFDNKEDYALTHQEVIAVSEYLTSKKVNHSIIFSGSGFHLRSVLHKENQNPEYCEKLATKLINMFMLETVDKSIYRLQGIIKTPYTIDFKTMRICTPIKKEDLNTFDYRTTELKRFVYEELVE